MAISTRPQAASTSLALKPRPGGRQRIGSADRRFFTEQLALLQETGNNLQASLQALRAQSTNPAMQHLLGELQQDIEQGRQLSAALARHPRVFSRSYVSLIAASEEGGYLHQVLEQLQEMEEKRERLRQALFSALSYPLFLMVFALAVVIFVLVVVFPKFADLFTLIADELPLTTLWLMAASDFLRQHWLALGIGLLSLFGAFGWWARSDSGRERLDRLKLRLPLLRAIFLPLYLVQSLRVLGSSLHNGVNVLEALHSCREVVANRVFQRFIGRLEQRVEQGQGLASGFAESAFIPPLVTQMVRTGEDSGQLAKVMLRLANHYERELEQRLETLSRLAEPVMLLIMGAVVGIIVSSLILPIFKLSHAVG
jgi:type II secretory pathway component PulF